MNEEEKEAIEYFKYFNLAKDIDDNDIKKLVILLNYIDKLQKELNNRISKDKLKNILRRVQDYQLNYKDTVLFNIIMQELIGETDWTNLEDKENNMIKEEKEEYYKVAIEVGEIIGKYGTDKQVEVFEMILNDYKTKSSEYFRLQKENEELQEKNKELEKFFIKWCEQRSSLIHEDKIRTKINEIEEEYNNCKRGDDTFKKAKLLYQIAILKELLGG